MLKSDEIGKIKIFAFQTQILRFRCENLDFSFFVRLQHSLSLRVLEIWQRSNNQKASILIEVFESENFFGARALPRALRAMISAPKISFLTIFSSTGGCAHIWHAQVRARKFGARHRIEHHQSNILYIYNIFISLKVAEIECFEVFRDRRASLKIREKKVPHLRTDQKNQMIFSYSLNW